MKKYFAGCFLAAVMLAACEKKVDPIDTFHVTVELNNRDPKYVTGDRVVNPKDSIYFDFTITSAQDMAYVEIQKNGARIDTFHLPANNRRSFSKVKGYMADSAAGDYTYRIIGRTSQAIFLGDGDKKIKVTVRPDFHFWSYRILSVPDTVAKLNKTYYSTRDGKTFSYSEGAANSASIDFGYYFDTTGSSTSTANDDLAHTIYALNATQPQLSYYDIGSWTKNATVFKKMPSNVNFVSGLTSAGAINTLIRNNMTSGTSNKVNGLTTAAPNNVIGFRTADGKYGAILIRFIRGASPAKETSIEVDVKVQK